MPDSEPPPTPAKLELGTHAVLQLRAAPRVQLTPTRAAQELKQAYEARVPLKGTCQNLTKEVTCQLVWLVGNQRITHPRRTVLVPDGGAYAVKEQAGDDAPASDPLWSALELQISGSGLLGYALKLELLGEQSLEVLPKDSGLSYDLPLALELLVEQPNPERPETQQEIAAQRDASHALALGRPAKLRPEIGEGFRDCRIHLTVTQVRTDGSHIAETERALEWVRGAEAPAAFSWAVGSMPDPSTPQGPTQYLFARLEDGSPLHFLYEMEVSPPASKGNSPKLRVSARDLCWVATPKLEQLELSVGGEADTRHLTLEGRLSGLAGNATFPLEVELFVRNAGPPPFVVTRLSDLVGASPHEGEGLEVKDGAFSASALVPPGVLAREAVVDRLAGRQLFAELRLPARSFGPGGRRMPFSRFIEYQPASAGAHAEGEAAIGPRAVYAPSTDGTFEWWLDAVGVTSNWVTLEGRSGLIEVLDLDVPADRHEEFRWFFATICGEAIGQTEPSWRAVAHVIMNRANAVGANGKPTFGASIKELVQAPKQFSSYADANKVMSENFKTGLVYCDPSTRGSLTAAQLQLHDKVKRATLPVFLGKAGVGLNVTDFFSPEAQRKQGKPAPDYSAYIDITAELYAGAEWDDFRFFRRPGAREIFGSR